jgi:hypothetical protein
MIRPRRHGAGREMTMNPSAYDAYLADQVEEYMRDDDEFEADEPDYIDYDDEASDYELMECCP